MVAGGGLEGEGNAMALHGKLQPYIGTWRAKRRVKGVAGTAHVIDTNLGGQLIVQWGRRTGSYLDSRPVDVTAFDEWMNQCKATKEPGDEAR